MYKKYMVFVDGHNCGVVELTPADVTSLLSDSDIRIIEL